MLKKYSLIGLIAFSLNTQAKEEFSIEVTSDNQVITSKNLKTSNIQILEGLEAAELYKKQLLSSIDALAKSSTIRKMYESEALLEDLVYVDSFIEKYQLNANKATVNGTGSYCNNNTFLNYTFRDSFFRYSMDSRASTGTVGPFPPGTPNQYVTAVASTNNGVQRTDTDFSSGQSLFVSALATVSSGLHSSATPVPFVAQGSYFISLGSCFATKLIRVEGTKAFGSPAVISSITN